MQLQALGLASVPYLPKVPTSVHLQYRCVTNLPSGGHSAAETLNNSGNLQLRESACV